MSEQTTNPSSLSSPSSLPLPSNNNNNNNNNNDSLIFNNLLQRISSTNFELIEKSKCIGIGFDSEGIDTIYIIPRLGLDMVTTTNNVTEEEILEIMLLYFLQIAEKIVTLPYNIVYGHSVFSLYSQVKTLQYIYKILPRRYKKNLMNLYIVHPTGRVKVFVRMSKLFFGKKVIQKMKFVSCIAELQSIISPLTLSLPPSYLLWEDNVYFRRTIDEMPTLIELFDETLDAPVFVVQCIDFLRRYGIHREGLFRVAGDQILFEVAKVRIHKTGGTNVIICPPPVRPNENLIRQLSNLNKQLNNNNNGDGDDDDGDADYNEHNTDNNEEYKRSLDRQNTIDSQRDIGRSISLRDLPTLPPRLSFREKIGGLSRKNLYPIADVVLHDVDEVAQLLKSFLRDLPEPVITTAAYKALMEASKLHFSSQEDSIQIIEQILVDPQLMPTAHSRTFEYLMSFLTVLARESQINKMSPDNISVVFAPTLMRMEMTDPIQALQEVKVSQKILKALLLKRMEAHLSVEFSTLRLAGGMNTRLGKVIR